MTYIIILIITCIILTPLYMLILAFQINVKEHSLHIGEMKDGEQFRVFFISDIHRRKIPNKLIDTLLGRVDIVIIGGDLTEKGVPLERTENNILQLCRIGKVFYVYGNNDREVGEPQLNSILEKYGVCILNNKSVVLKTSQSIIRLIGINDGFNGRVNIYDAFQDVLDEEIIIFVSHAPAFFNNAKKVAQPHLLLAGHLHGGQIRFGPFGIYENGAFREKENSAELISNGFGTTGVPLRLGAKSECHIITLFGKATVNNF
ncbi:metallophosphoesterase [Psychrobacillus sp. L4]|uniref:metallophosphoesterase n=1 Tax=Psychrobacillus sp. L4 TaxID=3236892 RepID=UPI0036F44252